MHPCWPWLDWEQGNSAVALQFFRGTPTYHFLSCYMRWLTVIKCVTGKQGREDWKDLFLFFITHTVRSVRHHCTQTLSSASFSSWQFRSLHAVYKQKDFWSFSFIIGPKVWNSYSDICCIKSTPTFRQALKTHLFKTCFLFSGGTPTTAPFT